VAAITVTILAVAGCSDSGGNALPTQEEWSSRADIAIGEVGRVASRAAIVERDTWSVSDD
jgi:hypothetical protein